MKYLNRIMAGFAVLAGLALMPCALLAQGGDRGEAKATIGGTHVTVEYGRPSLKGRDPLSMIKPGQVWRLGASAPTTIESDKDLDVGGTKLAKGRHILVARFDGPGKWALVVSSKSAFEYAASDKIAETPMTFEQTQDSVETMTISLAEKNGTGVITVAWGKMRLTAEFKPAS